jgi:hypothetical protein
MHDIFISYTRDDQEAAAAIADRLSAAGFSVFFDRQAIVAGESWSARIGEELRTARAVVALLSSRSRRSTWVADELQEALDSKKLVVPVLLDQGAKENWLWPLLATRQSIQLDLESPNWNSQLNELAHALSQALGKEPMVRRRVTEKAAVVPPEMAPLSAATHLWKLVALAIASAAVGAVITWLLTH